MENKFLELLQKNGQVSMANDLFPIIFDEFNSEVLSDELCEMISEFASQLIYSAFISGIQVVCLPKFGADQTNASLSLIDMVYKVV